MVLLLARAGDGAAPAPRAAEATRKDAARSRVDEHAPLAEPLFGFLPRGVQRRLERETGYHALLYTKISILLSAGIGVLLAGSWEPVSEAEIMPWDAVLRVGAGLYLLAESFHRYLDFARGEPSGSIVGTVVLGALGSRRRSDRR